MNTPNIQRQTTVDPYKPPGRLKVVLLSLPPRTQAVLDFFIANTGRSSFTAAGEDSADAAVFDHDHPASRAHWQHYVQHRGKPGIVLSIQPQQLPRTVHVSKPITPAALLGAAADVMAGRLCPEAPPPAPEPAPVVADLAPVVTSPFLAAESAAELPVVAPASVEQTDTRPEPSVVDIVAVEATEPAPAAIDTLQNQPAAADLTPASHSSSDVAEAVTSVEESATPVTQVADLATIDATDNSNRAQGNDAARAADVSADTAASTPAAAPGTVEPDQTGPVDTLAAPASPASVTAASASSANEADATAPASMPAPAPATAQIRAAAPVAPAQPAAKAARSESLVQGVSGFLRKLILGEASVKATGTAAAQPAAAPVTLASLVAAADDKPAAAMAPVVSAELASASPVPAAQARADTPVAQSAPTTVPLEPAAPAAHAAPVANAITAAALGPADLAAAPAETPPATVPGALAAVAAAVTPVATPVVAAAPTGAVASSARANAVLPAPPYRPANKPVSVPAATAPVIARSNTTPARPVLAATRNTPPAPPAAARSPGHATPGHAATTHGLAKAPTVRPVAAAAAASTHAVTGLTPGSAATTPVKAPASAPAGTAAHLFNGHGGAPAVFADEALLCGNREDLSTSRWSSDSSLRYEPADHLIGALREAWQVGNKWRVPTHFELPQGKVVVDCSQGRVYTDFDRVLLSQIWAQPLARRPKTRTLNRQESREFDAVLAEPSNLLRLDQLLWRGGMLTSAGRLPTGVDPTRTVYLKHWPNFTRLERTPSAIRMAALWATRGASIIETAKLVNLPQRQVIAFYNGMLALDLITDDGGHIRRAQRKNQNRGLLTRLLGWLHH